MSQTARITHHCRLFVWTLQQLFAPHNVCGLHFLQESDFLFIIADLPLNVFGDPVSLCIVPGEGEFIYCGVGRAGWYDAIVLYLPLVFFAGTLRAAVFFTLGMRSVFDGGKQASPGRDAGIVTGLTHWLTAVLSSGSRSANTLTVPPVNLITRVHGLKPFLLIVMVCGPNGKSNTDGVFPTKAPLMSISAWSGVDITSTSGRGALR